MINRANTTVNARVVSQNLVLKNTYLLLGMTFCFSSLMTLFSMSIGAAPLNPILWIALVIGLQYGVIATSRSAWGIPMIFAFTGFLGYTLGPILMMYTALFSNGYDLIFTSLGATGLIFVSLSAYVVTHQKNYSYMGGILFSAILVAFMAGIAAILFNIPLLSIVVSGAFALISSALIMYHTSEIVHGGETNYILATMSIFVALFNLFLSLLRILAYFAGNRD